MQVRVSDNYLNTENAEVLRSYSTRANRNVLINKKDIQMFEAKILQANS